MSTGEKGKRERGETYGFLVNWWIEYATAAVPPIRPIAPEETKSLCLSKSLRIPLSSGVANDSKEDAIFGCSPSGGRSPEYNPEIRESEVDSDVDDPDACVVIRPAAPEDDSGDDGRSNPTFGGRLSCGGTRTDDTGNESLVAPLPKPAAPDACVVIRFAAAEDDSGGKSSVAPLPAPGVCVVIGLSSAEGDPGSDPRYNHAHLSLGLPCGGIPDDDSGDESPVAPLPEPDAPDACVVIRSSAAEDDLGESGPNQSHHVLSGGGSCGGIGDAGSGGKLLVSPSSEPGPRFSDAALTTSGCLCRTTAGAASATSKMEKIRRIRTNVLS